MKRAAEKAKKEYLESVCDDLTEFQTAGRYDLPYMETKELGWKEHRGIQNIGAEFSEGNIIADNGHVLEIWENYTGHFIMFSVITNIYNKKTIGPTLMELFTATGKLISFF
jgi:hypothetical protein